MPALQLSLEILFGSYILKVCKDLDRKQFSLFSLNYESGEQLSEGRQAYTDHLCVQVTTEESGKASPWEGHVAVTTSARSRTGGKPLNPAGAASPAVFLSLR